MHTMFIWELPFIDNDLFPARKPAAFTLICFEDKHFQSTLHKMQCGRQPRDARANNDDIIVFLHCGDYISEIIRWLSKPAWFLRGVSKQTGSIQIKYFLKMGGFDTGSPALHRTQCGASVRDANERRHYSTTRNSS